MFPSERARQHIDPVAGHIQQFDFQRHLAQRVGGAGQAGIEGADGNLDVIEQAFGELAPVDILARDLADGFVSSTGCCGWWKQSGCKRMIWSFSFHLVVVDQLPRGASITPTTACLAFTDIDQLVALKISVEQQLLDQLGGMQHLYHARPVEAQRPLRSPNLRRRP